MAQETEETAEKRRPTPDRASHPFAQLFFSAGQSRIVSRGCLGRILRSGASIIDVGRGIASRGGHPEGAQGVCGVLFIDGRAKLQKCDSGRRRTHGQRHHAGDRRRRLQRDDG